MSHGTVQRRDAPKCILVVEDDQAISDMLVMLLELEGYQVKQAETGSIALAMLAQQPHAQVMEPCGGARPDLVLLDLQLPGLEGDSVIRQAVERGVDVPPVIVVSAKRSESVHDAADRIGAAGVVLKPFQIDALLAAIREALNQPPLSERAAKG